jgi:hypothetical protein
MIRSKYLLACLLFILSSSGFAYELPNNTWKIISLPAEPPKDQDTVKAIFGDDFAGDAASYGTKWILFSYNTETSKYDDLKYEDPVKQGQGYWMIQQTGRGVTLKMPEGSVNTPNSYALKLASSSGGAQWNLTGNPFSESIKLGGFSVKTTEGVCSDQACGFGMTEAGELVHNQVWTYDGQAYIKKEASDSVDSWEGFWVAALKKSQGLSLIYKGAAPSIVTIMLDEYPKALGNPMKGFRPGYKNTEWTNSALLHPYMRLPKWYIAFNNLENDAADDIQKIKDYSNTLWAELPSLNSKVVPRVYIKYQQENA